MVLHVLSECPVLCSALYFSVSEHFGLKQNVFQYSSIISDNCQYDITI